MYLAKIFGLFVVTAVAEIAGCYLPYLWLKKAGPVWLLAPGALSLALFVWLLSLHPQAAGRVYAAYGGVYITGRCSKWRATGRTRRSSSPWSSEPLSGCLETPTLDR